MRVSEIWCIKVVVLLTSLNDLCTVLPPRLLFVWSQAKSMILHILCLSLRVLQMLMFDFTHHNIEMACALLETCGRFLYRSPDSHYRTKVYLVGVSDACLTLSQQNLSGWCFSCSPFSHYHTKVCIVVVWCLSHSISAKSIWLMFLPLSFLSLSYQGLPGSCLNYHLPVCHARQPWGKCVKVFGTETICIFCNAFFDRSSEQASHVFLEWVQATTKNIIIFTS